MGRINFGDKINDRKGLTDKVFLEGKEVLNWNHYVIDLGSDFINNLKPLKNQEEKRPGFFFRAEVNLKNNYDTYIDMSNFIKGVTFVNDFNLGRYWNKGP